MSWISKGILLFNVLVLLVGSVGINVFRHTCEEDGTMTSYFVNLDDHCSTHVEELPSCCQKKGDTEGKQRLKKDCCSDAFSYMHYQPLTDLHTDLQVKECFKHAISSFSHAPQVYLTYIPITEARQSTKPPPQPFKKHGIRLLIQHGTLRL